MLLPQHIRGRVGPVKSGGRGPEAGKLQGKEVGHLAKMQTIADGRKPMAIGGTCISGSDLAIPPLKRRLGAYAPRPEVRCRSPVGLLRSQNPCCADVVLRPDP